jgi:hypothetical protein
MFFGSRDLATRSEVPPQTLKQFGHGVGVTSAPGRLLERVHEDPTQAGAAGLEGRIASGVIQRLRRADLVRAGASQVESGDTLRPLAGVESRARYEIGPMNRRETPRIEVERRRA